MNILKYLTLSIFLACISPCLTASPDEPTAEDEAADTAAADDQITPALVYTMVISGAIGAVTDDRIADAIEQAEDDNAELLVIMLDTPGGFTEPTWSICKRILNSNVPVCIYIAPTGSRAGSAGVYMTYSAHFAAMAPATHIGAAHPVAGAGEKLDSVLSEKITHDAAAQIRSTAEKRGRNAEWAEKAVRESVSITEKEALQLNVVNLLADNIDDLLDKLDGQETELPYGKKVLRTRRARVEEIKPTFAQKVLEIIVDPNIALILFSIGGLGIILELYNPGAILPGVVGAISLILAFYALSTLPINVAGLALIILAFILFFAEVKVVSHGLLTLGGIVSFFLGGLMLVDTVDPGLRVSLSLLITIAVLAGLAVLLVMWLVAKAYRKQPSIGQEGIVGKVAEVRPGGFVYVNGALWKAESDEELIPGTKVVIESIESLKLKVRKADT